MGTKTKTKTTPGPTGLERSAADLAGPVRRTRDKQPHDRLHLLPSGHCGCMCPHCWRWLIVGQRGVCICFDCGCGGMPGWLPGWFPAVTVEVTP